MQWVLVNISVKQIKWGRRCFALRKYHRCRKYYYRTFIRTSRPLTKTYKWLRECQEGTAYDRALKYSITIGTREKPVGVEDLGGVHSRNCLRPKTFPGPNSGARSSLLNTIPILTTDHPTGFASPEEVAGDPRNSVAGRNLPYQEAHIQVARHGGGSGALLSKQNNRWHEGVNPGPGALLTPLRQGSELPCFRC